MKYLIAKDEFLETLKQNILISKGYVPLNTLRAYAHYIDRFGDFVSNLLKIEISDLKLSDTNEDHLKQYLLTQIENGKKTISRNTEFYCFKSFFSKISKKHNIDDISKDIEKIRFNYKRKDHFPEEYKVKLINFIENLKQDDKFECRNKLYFKTFFITGWRASDILKLNMNSFKQIKDTLFIETIEKGNKELTYPLPLLHKDGTPIEKNKKYLELLYHYMYKRRTDFLNHANEKALFLSKKGKRLSYRTINDIFTSYLVQLGLEKLGYSTHTIRHTVATNLLDKGIPLKMVSQLLGHSSIQTTEMFYVNREEKVLKDALMGIF